ncbi:hypothetical protein AC578_10953 [Pseudocercospora eumusae]|uniref:Uncharacterized protein n=1 Tax=Pseudocercospora eumusae TaxID=321146 RepID=A0A139HSC6_9PEZI|nr:hypothetical protein AC578_10953 [Pseudocercospora eumusae]
MINPDYTLLPFHGGHLPVEAFYSGTSASADAVFHDANTPAIEAFHDMNTLAIEAFDDMNTPAIEVFHDMNTAASEAIHERTSPPHEITSLRQQILANAQLLYPILRGQTRKCNDHDYLLGTREQRNDKPTLMLVTTGVKPHIIAHVVFRLSQPASDEGLHALLQNHEQTPYALLQGPDAGTQIEALEGLLKLSSSVLKDRWNVRRRPSMDHVRVEDGGYYYLTR